MIFLVNKNKKLLNKNFIKLSYVMDFSGISMIFQTPNDDLDMFKTRL